LYLAFVQSPGNKKTIASLAHEPGPAMLMPMAGLSIGSIFSGFFFRDMFIGLGTCSFSSSILVSPSNAYEFGAEFAPYIFKSLPLVLSLTGIILSLLIYSKFGEAISRF
jgi:NADH:ubiquinone oxidoreductase subunit 5 (subunit L)/multisubunit Na+/H+ antiporter MnhA subunit